LRQRSCCWRQRQDGFRRGGGLRAARDSQRLEADRKPGHGPGCARVGQRLLAREQSRIWER